MESSIRSLPITSRTAAPSSASGESSPPCSTAGRNGRSAGRHIAELRKRATEAEAKLKRLYDAIENGVADLADPG